MSVSQHAALDAGRGRRSAGQIARDVVLFFAAPFITIAYLVLFPFIGALLLVRKDERLWHRSNTAD